MIKVQKKSKNTVKFHNIEQREKSIIQVEKKLVI